MCECLSEYLKCRRGSVLWRDIRDFFLSFRLKTAAFSLPIGVFVSTSREREKNVSFREKQTLSRRRRYAHKYFFFAERKQAEQLYKFCFFVCLCFFSFVRFTRERLAF